MKYIYLFLTIIFTVYGQLILKWRMDMKGAMPALFQDKIKYFWDAFLDIWVLSSFASAFIASITWMMTLTKFELSYAYPFMSLSFVLVFLFSAFLFNESVTTSKIVGLLLVIGGLIILAQK